MKPIEAWERYNVLNNYKILKPKELKECYEKLSKRMDYLEPVIYSLDKYDINILNINKEFAQEYFEIKALLLMLNEMKK